MVTLYREKINKEGNIVIKVPEGVNISSSGVASHWSYQDISKIKFINSGKISLFRH